MQYRPLGKTGLEVSRVCFGALTVGPCQADLAPEAAGEIIHRAFELGVNFIDTAQLYRSYAHIAAALKKPTPREIIISSKTYAYEKQAAFEAVEEARKGLDRDVIDIFLLHEQESEHTLRGHAPALEELYRLKSLGVIRAVGISTHHIAGVRAATAAGLDVVPPLLTYAGYGILDGSRDEMDAAAREAAEAGLGVFLMKPFGGGNLLAHTSECFAYSLSRDYAASVAVGMQSLTEVEANLHFAEHGEFPADLAKILRTTKRRLLVEDWCEGCGVCENACPQEAIRVDPAKGIAVCDASRCVTCGYCGMACPQSCLKII